MAEISQPSRRRRVEPGIYTRTDAAGRETFEIGFRDSQGQAALAPRRRRG